jgi:protein-tyrosine kinase
MVGRSIAVPSGTGRNGMTNATERAGPPPPEAPRDIPPQLPPSSEAGDGTEPMESPGRFTPEPHWPDASRAPIADNNAAQGDPDREVPKRRAAARETADEDGLMEIGLLDREDGSASVAGSAPETFPEAPPSALVFDYAYSRRIACLADPAGAAAAAYRSLQTHLLAGHVRDGRRGLALCAPAPKTGCTTVAVNLAVAFAQAGINTLLVDANLHRPAVHDFIRPSEPALGLAQMLTADLDRRTDEIRRNIRPNLSVLYAGGVPARAHDLIANRRFKQIMDDCMRAFEFTIVDTSALRGSTDARHIAMGVRYGLLIARRNVTLLSDIRSAIDDLSNDRIRLVGSFLADF